MSQSLRTAKKKYSITGAPQSRSPIAFYPLVFVLAAPLWLIGALKPVELLPGLPLSSLMTFCPALAALVLVYKEGGLKGVSKLLGRAFDYGRIKSKAWLASAILILPGIMTAEFGILRLLHIPVPAPEFPVVFVLFLCVVFFVGALGEELGWMGYAVDPLQERLNALSSGIILGLIGSLWHIIPFLQAGRDPVWIFWQGLGIVGFRILTIWLYNNTGKSVFVAAVFHTMINVSWQLFPVNGSYYDPRITALIVLFVAVNIAFIWGPRRLSRS